ncbi:MAG TPA: hypothetical protein VJB37_00540 [Patescibacteria group bacterium]|nr:hypothetical protein [Patescibacteria group bacterium]
MSRLGKFFFLILVITVLIPGVTLAQYGLAETAGEAGLTAYGGSDLPTLIGKVLGTGLSLVGVLFFGLMIYGGITWMLAKGSAEEEKKALQTIIAAIIGIIIVLSSYAITKFVFSSIQSSGGPNTGSSQVATGCVAKATAATTMGSFCAAIDVVEDCTNSGYCELVTNDPVECKIKDAYKTNPNAFCGGLTEQLCKNKANHCDWK